MNDPLAVGKAKKDFRAFMWIIFKFFLWDVMKDPTNVQYDIASYLSRHKSTHKLIMAFRGIGKSYITALYCVWRLWNDPTLSILIVSASKERAAGNSNFILRLIKEVPFLNHLDPELEKGKGGRASKLAFDVAGSGNKQAPSVRAVGITGQIVGSRADIILADDIEIPNNSDTPIKRMKLRAGIEEFEAILRTGEGKEVIFLGTPQSQESIYTELPVGGEYGYDCRMWPAYYPKTDADLNYYGVRLAPFIRDAYLNDKTVANTPTDERFTGEELERRKAKYGRSGFALQFYLNTTLSDELKYPLKCRDLIFMDLDDDKHPEKPIWGTGDENMIKEPCQGFVGDAYFRPIKVEGDWRDYEGGVMAIDPSGRGADETAYAVIKWGGGYLYCLDCGGIPGGHDPEALEKIARIADRWKVNTMIVERNFGAGVWGELLRPVMKRYAPNCALPRPEDMPFHTKQKELRMIDVLEPVMNMHRLVMNKSIIQDDMTVDPNVPEEQHTDYRLFHQMTRLTKDRGSLEHDDRLDALSMSVAWAQRALGRDPDVEMVTRRRQEHMDAVWASVNNPPLHNVYRSGGFNRGPEVENSWVGRK